MKIKVIICTLLVTIFLCIPNLYSSEKAKKKIYIKPFSISDDITDVTIKEEIRDYMSEALVGEFSIISDDEVKEYIKNTEIKQALGGQVHPEKLILSIKTDFLIYGKIFKENGNLVIEANLLAMEEGEISIKNSGKIEYANRNYTDRASRALGKYLTMDRQDIGVLFGKNDPREEFKDEVSEVESQLSRIESDYKNESSSIKKAAAWRDKSLIRSPRFRIGYSGFGAFSTWDAYINELYVPQHLVMFDLFLYRYKDPVGDGIDLYARGTYRQFKAVEDFEKKVRVDNNSSSYIGVFEQMPVVEPGLDVVSGDLGIRFVGSVCFFRSALSFYMNFAGRYNYSMEKVEYTEESKIKTLQQWGVVGGAGIEISIVPYVGVFAEFNSGYVPMGRKDVNLEGPQFLLGVTVRTQHWDL